MSKKQDSHEALRRDKCSDHVPKHRLDYDPPSAKKCNAHVLISVTIYTYIKLHLYKQKYKNNQQNFKAPIGRCRAAPFGVGIDHRLLLGSTIGSWWDRPSALLPIDRRLLVGSTIGSWWDKSCAQTQQRTHVALCISLVHSNNDEYRVFL
jgi:hypothetical protein